MKGGNPDYMLDDEDLQDNLNHKPHPLFKKKGGGGGGAKAKSKWRQKHTPVPHHRNTGTQYTPKSSVRTRERPPLDYVPKSGSLSTVFATPKSRGSLHTVHSRFSSAAPTQASERTQAHSVSHHKPVQEIEYPLTNAADTRTTAAVDTPKQSRRDPSVTSVKQVCTVWYLVLISSKFKCSEGQMVFTRSYSLKTPQNRARRGITFFAWRSSKIDYEA